MKKILLIILIACLNQINAQVCFYTPTTYSTDVDPWAICKGDFNEDGKLDLVTSTIGANDVSVLLGTGTGSFGPAVTFPISANIRTVYSADFNHDGHADLVTCNTNSHNISILLGTGTGSFGTATNYSINIHAMPLYATSADYNGDGFIDLAVNDSYAGSKVDIFMGNGTGSFGAPTSYSLSASYQSSDIVSADVTADGKIDLIVSNYIQVVVYPGNGNGTFGTPIIYATDGSSAQTQELIANDFNSDGYIDIVTTNFNSNSLSVFLGNSSGTFGAVTNIPLSTYPFGISSADFNSDGKLDIAVSTNSDNNLDVLLGDGAGNFGTAFVFPLSSTNTHDCVTGDFNSDGKPDVAIAGLGSSFVSVLLNSLPNPVTITGNTTICAGNSTILTAGGTDAYTWSTNAASATTNTVSVSAGTTATYTVSGNNTGCSVLSTKTITVNVNALPNVVVNPSSSATVCPGSSITLSATGANTYTWTGGISNGVSLSPTASQNYSVTGTDLHGCNNTVTVSIFQPTVINPTIFSQVNVSGCYGQSNGSAAISTSGGYGSLTYNWAPSGGTTNSASNLTANIYTCTITDALSCTKTQTVNITQPPVITAIVSAQTNLSCNGVNTGSASISAGGGTGSLTYNWSPSGGTANSAGNLAAGSYVCTITDANSCTKTQTVSITQPNAITSSISSQINVMGCNGDNTGSAIILAGGGTGVLTYSWLPTGAITDSIKNLPAGSYTCTITDANNCAKTQTVNITQPTAITSSISSQNNVSGCYGQSNGASSISATGGTGSLTYNWLPSGGTSATASNLSAGSYTCTITDMHTCIATQTVSITQPPAIIPVIISQNDVTGCYGQNTGSVSISATGGTGALSYVWTPSGSTLTTLTNISAGTYTCTISDLNSCTKTQTVTINQPAAITSSIVSQSNVTCVGADNGAATISAGGGTGSLNYNWLPSGGTTTTALSLAVGSYTCVITDSNNCSKSQVVSIIQGALSIPAICMVTTDTAFTNNIIYWDKTLYPNADSFLVYRYSVSSASYLNIGSVSKDSSQLTDINRNIGGPNGGDPNITSWRYKLAIKDTCGNVSAMSPYHETVNLQQNNQNIIWNAYVIESPQANPVTGYQVLRDSLGIGDWHVFVNTLGTSTNDPNYANYPNALYRVDAIGFNCNPTLFLSSGNNSPYVARVKSHSNQSNNRQAAGINKIASDLNNKVSIYPNPNNGNFFIESDAKQTLQICDVNGKVVFSQIVNGKNAIDVSILSEGVYNINFINTKGILNKRLIIVK